MKTRQFFEEWHKERDIEVRPSTLYQESIYIFGHIVPFFEDYGAIELENIKPYTVDLYCKTKLREGRKDGKKGGLSAVSVRKHLSMMRQAFAEAVIKGYIDVNPAREVRVKKRSTTCDDDKYKFYTPEQAQNLLEVLKKDGETCKRKVIDTYPIVAVALFYGLRKEEVIGLRWSAIDFKNKTISICHTVTKQDKVYKSDETKTSSSRRKYDMHPQIEQVLREVYENAVPWSEYVFASDDGEPLRPDCVLRSFQRALKRQGFEDLRFHDLRHICAGLLMYKKVPLEDIKNYLGHSDIETTSNIYIHFQKSGLLLNADIMGNMLNVNCS